MKRYFKNLLIASATFILVLLVSCDVAEGIEVENDNDVIENTIDEEIKYGDILIELEGEVNTLSKYKLPKKSDVLYGFEIKGIYDYKQRNAKVVLFEHIKSGARSILISNDDEDKATCFGFNTLTYDDKGIPHVFEHACLGGSEKYPSANLFEEARNKTYNTYMNATTMQHSTAYPISSLSNEQLFALYKFYFDGIMNPGILRNEKNLEREAYRYVLNDKNDEIELIGVAYSEMSGTESDITSEAYNNVLKTLFNGSFMGAITGGRTSEIPKTTVKDLIDFHNKYYSPSNMVITLYGDIDYEKYLKYANDEYLANYERINIDKSDNEYKVNDGFEIRKYDFPVANGTDLSGQTIVDYAVHCDGMSPYESGLLGIVLQALNNSDGPIKRRITEKIPDANFVIWDCTYMPKPFFLIRFNNVDEKAADIIKEIVEASFEELKNDGIDKDILESIINIVEVDNEKTKDSHGFADEMTLFNAMLFSSNGDDLLGFLRNSKAIEEIEKAYNNGDIKKLIDKYLSSDKKAAIVITAPKAGLLEENNLKLNESLRNMKEKMTDDEISELIKKTEEYNIWEREQSAKSLINLVRVASVSELEEYKANCYAYEENTEGIRFIKSDIEGIKYNYFNMLFDVSNVKYEDILKLKFLSNLLFKLPTTNYPLQKLEANFAKETYQYGAGIHLNRYFDGGYKPYFSFNAMSLDKNIDKVFELLDELMHETKFEDINIAKNVASVEYNNLKGVVSYNPTAIAQSIVEVITDSDSKYDYHINGINYLNFLNKVKEMSDEEILFLLKECENILKCIYNKNGFICQIIGNFDTIKNIKTKIINMSQNFKVEKIEQRIYEATFSEIKNKVAVISTGNMQYNYIATPMKTDGIKYTAKYIVLANIIDDKILYPEFRVKKSAYGSYASLSRIHSFICTYRDPNLKESYEMFNQLPTEVKNMELSNEELEDYKLHAYADFSYPLTKFGAAQVSINEVFNKVSEKRPSRYMRYMKEIKETTIDDIKELSNIIEKMINDGIYVAVGSKEQIENNADMFDEIIYDYVK